MSRTFPPILPKTNWGEVMRRATASASFPVGTMRRSPSEQSLASHTSRQSKVTTRPVVDSLLQEKELLERKLAAVNSVLELEVEQFGDGDYQFVDSDEDDRGQVVLEDDDDDDAWVDQDDDDQKPGDDNNDETTAKLHSNGGSPHHHGNATSDDHHDNGSEDGQHDYQQQQFQSEVPLSLIRREREVEMEFRKLREILQLMGQTRRRSLKPMSNSDKPRNCIDNVERIHSNNKQLLPSQEERRYE
jgi:hypothetical protein